MNSMVLWVSGKKSNLGKRKKRFPRPVTGLENRNQQTRNTPINQENWCWQSQQRDLSPCCLVPEMLSHLSADVQPNEDRINIILPDFSIL